MKNKVFLHAGYSIVLCVRRRPIHEAYRVVLLMGVTIRNSEARLDDDVLALVEAHFHARRQTYLLLGIMEGSP
jgi:hypothetical protein